MRSPGPNGKEKERTHDPATRWRGLTHRAVRDSWRWKLIPNMDPAVGRNNHVITASKATERGGKVRVFPLPFSVKPAAGGRAGAAAGEQPATTCQEFLRSSLETPPLWPQRGGKRKGACKNPAGAATGAFSPTQKWSRGAGATCRGVVYNEHS